MWRLKGLLSKDCPNSNNSIHKSINSNVSNAEKDTLVNRARKAISTSYISPKTIWVPKTVLINLDGPNKTWVPKGN